MSKDISIIGGGILGMTLALKLSRKGFEVTVFEAADEVGGLAASWQIDQFTWDKFYHVILKSDVKTRGLLTDLGIEKDINWVETKTGFYVDGKLHSLSNSIEYLTFKPLGLISKFRLGLTILVASMTNNWKKLEKANVTDWLIKWSGKKTFEKIWLPLLKAKLGDNMKDTSASFIWATIQRMYAARRSGLKKEMFGYAPGGYRTVLKALKDCLSSNGVKVITGHQLSELTTKDGIHVLRFSNGEEYKSRRVVFTIPSPKIIACWKDMPGDERMKHEGIRYMGVSCTSVVLKKDISPYYVTNITDTRVPFTGVIEMSALADKSNFGGNALVYLPKYANPEDEIFRMSDEEIHQMYKSTLLRMYPHLQPDDFLFMKTAKVPLVFALNTLEYSTNIPSPLSKVKGVYYGNSAMITNSTLNVNETVEIAEKISNLITV